MAWVARGLVVGGGQVPPVCSPLSPLVSLQSFLRKLPCALYRLHLSFRIEPVTRRARGWGQMGGQACGFPVRLQLSHLHLAHLQLVQPQLPSAGARRQYLSLRHFRRPAYWARRFGERQPSYLWRRGKLGLWKRLGGLRLTPLRHSGWRLSNFTVRVERGGARSLPQCAWQVGIQTGQPAVVPVYDRRC